MKEASSPTDRSPAITMRPPNHKTADTEPKAARVMTPMKTAITRIRLRETLKDSQIRLAVAVGLGRLAGKAAHRADPGDGLLGGLVGTGERVLRGLRELRHPAPDHHRAEGHRRHQGQHQEGEPHRRGRQQRQPTHHHHQIAQTHREVDADRVLHDGGVGGQAAGELAGLAGVEEGDLLVDDRAVDGLAQPGDDALAGNREEVVAQGNRHRLHGEDRGHDDSYPVDGRGATRDGGVDQDPDHLRIGEARSTADQEEDRGHRQPPPLGRSQRQQPPQRHARVRCDGPGQVVDSVSVLDR